VRTLAAVAGVSFALLLIFMQAGFLAGARTNAAIVYSALDCDLVIHARAFRTLADGAPFDRFRLAQAAAVPGVASVAPLALDFTQWRHAGNGSTAECIALGVPTDRPVFLAPATQALLPALRGAPAVLVDRLSRPSLGPWRVGSTARLDRDDFTVAGTFALGAGVVADGFVVVDEIAFGRLFGAERQHLVQLGLIKLAPGADPAAVLAALRAALPRDVTVTTKAAAMRHEGDFYVTVKPAGILFQTGMAIAFFAGAVILCQILGAELANRVREFATLKALGWTDRAVTAAALGQGFVYVLLAYVPAFALALGIYALARHLAGFPVHMEPARAVLVFLAALGMCACAALLALGRVRRADPAALFGR
jgi:putative ABC transport system permease protein